MPFIGRAETTEEQPLYDLLTAAVDAQFGYDFRQLVTFLHPAATKLFRQFQSARFDQLVEIYPVKAVCAAAGIVGHPKDLVMNDADFFLTTCVHAQTVKPDFVGDPEILPLKMHGYIFDGDMAFAVLSYVGNIHTRRTDFDYHGPVTINFQKLRGRWLIASAVLARRVADLWWRQLSAPVQLESAPR